MSDTAHLNPASRRHWMYGMNAALLVAIGIAILGFLLYLANQTKAWGSFDWTGNGANSLSASTKNMLKEMADKSQSYKLLSLFPGASDAERREGITTQNERRQQIMDLLNQYGRRSKQVTVEDAGDKPTEEIERQVRDLYAGELKPYEETIAAFDPLAKKMSDFFDDEAAAIGAAAQKIGNQPKDVQAAVSLQNQFRELPGLFDGLKRSIHRDTDAVLPRWGTIKSDLLTRLDTIQLEAALTLLSDKVKVKEAMPAPLADYFISANDRYRAITNEFVAYKEKLTKLPELKVDEVLETLRRNTVVILGKDAAKIVAESQLYEISPDASGGSKPVTTFNGEQAISSAMFAMVRPDKVKVVFVGAAGGRGPSIYNDIREILKAENFDTFEWSPPSPSPGGPPPEPTEPPAQGRGVIWVVFPPEADPQMMMMGMSAPGNPQPIIDATRKHMADGGQVMFLAEAAGGNPMMMGPASYPYDDLVKDFGVDVQAKYTVVVARDREDPNTGERVRQPNPYIPVERFEDHEITKPIQSLPTIFGPARTQSAPSFVTAVGVKSPPPAGVDAKVLIQTPATADYWGETTFGADAKFDKGTDLGAPVPLAVVAVKNKGQKDKDGKSLEQRVVVFGSKQFASDFFLGLREMVALGGFRVAVPQFPGNQELMKNSILWLAGYENMIAVSAKVAQASRIGYIPETKLALIRWGVLGGAPVAALVLGGLMWMVRRR